MGLLNVFIFLIVLSSIFGYVNVRFLKLPTTIGLMVMAIVFSVVMLVINYFDPQLFSYAEQAVEKINFPHFLLNVMLSFLLFAGALHTDISLLRSESRSIILFSVLGVIISAFLIALCMYAALKLTGYKLDFIYCLLFGALISPTDPIAVLGILAKANVPKKVEINIVGESLFNDGIGVVLFISILEIITKGVGNVSFGYIGLIFLQEVIGGLAFGLLLGYLIYLLLKSIDHYETEVMITISMVMGGYYLASILHVSGPLAIVVAGLITGTYAKEFAMSQTTTLYVFKFWELVDVIMNALLFVLIGLRLMVLHYESIYFPAGLIAIPIVVLSRLAAIKLPMLLSKKWIQLGRKDQLLMVWGGLRGGLSIAMALSLSANEPKDIIVFITYIVVLFSILVQGLTVGRFAKRLYS